TATLSDGSMSQDIPLAAQSTATVVILMGMAKLEQITNIFAQYGKAETPVAIIQNGTSIHQRHIIGTVKDIFSRAQEHGFDNPSIIVIGEVVRLANDFRTIKQLAEEHAYNHNLHTDDRAPLY
ncbi:MAG TPA: hypothetical protein VL947_12245, partial [Cytophagales bacterium]|nr:hypothetical protein [Cytophagales bacterium]